MIQSLSQHSILKCSSFSFPERIGGEGSDVSISVDMYVQL